MFRRRLAAAAVLVALIACRAMAQPPGGPEAGFDPTPGFGPPGGFGRGGPGGFGGPGGQDRKLVGQFDKDGDKRLSNSERQAAREFLKTDEGAAGDAALFHQVAVPGAALAVVREKPVSPAERAVEAGPVEGLADRKVVLRGVREVVLLECAAVPGGGWGAAPIESRLSRGSAFLLPRSLRLRTRPCTNRRRCEPCFSTSKTPTGKPN